MIGYAIVASLFSATVITATFAYMYFSPKLKDAHRRIDVARERAGEHLHERIKVEMELAEIKRQRSETTRKGNLTKSANRRKLMEATTAKLRGE